MNKIIPVALLIAAVIGLIITLAAFIFVLLTAAASMPAIGLIAVVLLLISCIINVPALALGMVFKGKLCKAALVISVISLIIVFVGFIIMFSA